MKRLVLKDFLALKEGDIISFSNGSDNKIYVSVGNRQKDVAFYGNEKGIWSKDNHAPRSGNNPIRDYKPGVHFNWVKENIPQFTAMEFKMPQRPNDLTKHLHSLYSQIEWEQMCMDKIINDLEACGVI